ncbi:hypothetical protein [Rhodovulum adriaticum]|uniref:Uncharacterized protein n=1 Tax=Rhodovulum adriaticum TaxID=35804 RepID=A0A4R2NTB2_RHOAD|nr:hypothetical protein [Rhodovulum adriaticum]TCP25259.1 hypothetical protein EV656_1038 [Rhodovulum adriaticum]
MPFHRFAAILCAALGAAALTVALITALPGHGIAVLLPLALIGALVLRLVSRK